MSIKYGQIGDAQHRGNDGQDLVSQIFSNSHRRVKMGGRSGVNADKWDILVDGRWRVEVKTAGRRDIRGAPTWVFNIHRHGVLDESKVDFYVLRLEEVPYSKHAIHLLLPSPLKQLTLVVTFRKFLNGFGQYAEAFHEFRKTGENPFLAWYPQTVEAR